MIMQQTDGHFYDPMNSEYICECPRCAPDKVKAGFVSRRVIKNCKCIQPCNCDKVFPSFPAVSTPAVDNILSIRIKKLQEDNRRLSRDLQIERMKRQTITQAYEVYFNSIQNQLADLPAILQRRLSQFDELSSSLDASSEKFGGVQVGSPSTEGL